MGNRKFYSTTFIIILQQTFKHIQERDIFGNIKWFELFSLTQTSLVLAQCLFEDTPIISKL